MRLFLFPLLLTLSVFSSSTATLASNPKTRTLPAPRSYNSHDYFSIELDPRIYPSMESAKSVASDLGVELIEQVGELEGHWLVRAKKDDLEKRDGFRGSNEQDANGKGDVEGYEKILKKWKDMKRKRNGASLSSSGKRSSHPDGYRSIQHLPTRQRIKRDFPVSKNFRSESPQPLPIQLPPSPLNSSHVLSSRQDKDIAADATELSFVQQTLGFTDPLLPVQWHLVNTLNRDIELNVTGLWGNDIQGQGVHVAIIDDGLDMHSDDLAANFFAEGSYDFNDHTALPEPRLSDDQHGTRCAGEIAAVPNDVCGVGVAPKAKVAGLRILSAPISDADEAAALNYEYQLNDIYSCSWGPPDDGKSMDAPENLILKALVNGVQKGRGGKGSIFVFAAGNGGGMDDQCNFDGYTNSIFSVTIGAMDRKGLHPYYSEMCAAMLAVAPSSGSGDHIHTTDVGKDKCTDGHGGTSAAAPLAVGVFALALQVRPDLTWRDIQHLLVYSAVHFNPEDPDWQMTANGRYFSYKYGYGRIDAGLFVEAARGWKLVKPQAWFDSPAVYLSDPGSEPNARLRRQLDEDLGVGAVDEDGTLKEGTVEEPVIEPSAGVLITDEGLESTYEITRHMLDDMNFDKLEHITIRVWIEHQRRGDVEVELISPSGVSSVLARQRRFDEADGGFQGWKFMSMKHWGEDPVGTWRIIVKDRINPEKVGRFQAWSLQLWGDVVDPALARLWAPAVEGEEDEEQTGSEPTPSITSQKPKPTNLLPGNHGSAEGEATKPGLAEPTPAPGAGDSADEVVTPPMTDIDYDNTSGFFGGMKDLATSPLGIYVSGGVILMIAVGAVIGLWVRARRRTAMFRDLTGERGVYRPVSNDLQMDDIGRRQRVKRTGHDDVFADEATEDEDEDEMDEGTALKYHENFLEDEEEGDGEQATASDRPYRDEPASVPLPVAPNSENGSSSSSWQDDVAEGNRTPLSR